MITGICHHAIFCSIPIASASGQNIRSQGKSSGLKQSPLSGPPLDALGILTVPTGYNQNFHNLFLGYSFAGAAPNVSIFHEGELSIRRLWKKRYEDWNKTEKRLEASLPSSRYYTHFMDFPLSAVTCWRTLLFRALIRLPIQPMLMDWVGKSREVPSSVSWASPTSLGHGW